MPGFAAHACGFGLIALVAMALAARRCRAPDVDSAPLRRPSPVDADDGRELIRASVAAAGRWGVVTGFSRFENVDAVLAAPESVSTPVISLTASTFLGAWRSAAESSLVEMFAKFARGRRDKPPPPLESASVFTNGTGGGRDSESGTCSTPLARRLLAGVTATSVSVDAAVRGGDCCSVACSGDIVLDVGGAEDDDEETEREDVAARGLVGLSDEADDATAVGDDTAPRTGSERHSSKLSSSSDVTEMGERDMGASTLRTSRGGASTERDSLSGA